METRGLWPSQGKPTTLDLIFLFCNLRLVISELPKAEIYRWLLQWRSLILSTLLQENTEGMLIGSQLQSALEQIPLCPL